MREVAEIKYETRVESDVDEQMIYAFKDDKDIVLLCRKGNKFFWKCLQSVNMVWYKEYDTIEKAIEGILEVPEYKQRKCGVVMEFDSTMEMILWCFSELGDFDVYKSKIVEESEMYFQKFLEIRGIEMSEYKAFVSTGVDLKKPHIIVVSKVPSGFWYSDMNGRTFNVKYATSKGEMRETEGFGGYDLSEILIVTDGDFKGNALLKSHCLLYGFGK